MQKLRWLPLIGLFAYIAFAAFSSIRQPLPSLLMAAAQGEIPTPESILVHVVARGDVLWRIAEEYGVTAESIMVANGLVNASRLEVGQPLVIPLTGFNTPTPTPLPPTFTPPPSLTPAPGTPIEYPTALDGFPTAQNLLGTLVPEASATPPPPVRLNDIPIEQFIVMPPSVVANARMIYSVGQALGNNGAAFSKIGDSTIESPFFMDRFDERGGYNLGDFAYLQPAIDQFRGSFARDSVAVRVGLHSWSIFDPMWSDRARCDGGESVIACEFRLNRPSAVFVRLGSNDAGVPEYFERNIRHIIEYSIENGVIPIVGTKADRHEGDNTNNDILRRLAAEYAVPLWDFDVLAATIPGRGLVADGVHMTTFYLHDWRRPEGLQTGNGLHSLAGLMMLDALWRETMEEAT